MQSGRKKQIGAGMVAILILLAFYFREQLFSILKVFALSAGFAVILSPICSRLEKHGVNPQIAAAISVFICAFLFLIAAAVLFPYIAVQLFAFIKNNLSLLKAPVEYVNRWAEYLGVDAQQWSALRDGLIKKANVFLSSFARVGVTIATGVGRYAFSTVMAYYLLCERWRICRHLSLFVPLPYRGPVRNALIGCKNAAMGYLSGMVKTSVFVFFVTYMGLILIRVPNAFFLSVVMGLLEALPYAGPILAAIPILLSAATVSMQKTIYALLIIIAVQQIESNFAGPYFAASSTAIRPFTALAGIFVLGTFFGIWGILLAVPALTVIQSVIWSILQTRSSLQT